MFTSRVIFSKDNFIRLFLQLIRALAVVRKCLPKIRGILDSMLTTEWVSKIRKSTK